MTDNQRVSFRDAFSWIAGAPRSAMSWKAFLPVWLWLLAADGLLRLAQGMAWTSLALATLAIPGLPVLAGCALLGARRGEGKPTRVEEWAAGIRRAWPVYWSGVLFTLSVPAFFIVLALVGALVGRLPLAGGYLLVVWMGTGGLVLSTLAGSWILVGVPSLALQVPASMIEPPDAMDVTSRSLSYVRRRPLLLGVAWCLNIASAMVGTAVVLVFLSIVLGCLNAMALVGRGFAPDPVYLWAQVRSLWAESSAWWPLPRPGLVLLGGTWGVVQPPAWAILLARLVPAFFFASLAAGAARVYMLVRRIVDGVAWTPHEEKSSEADSKAGLAGTSNDSKGSAD